MKDKLNKLKELLKQCKELADDLDLCWVANQSKHAINEIDKQIRSNSEIPNNSGAKRK